MKAWPRRVAVVFVVWLPIIYTLGAITSSVEQIILATLVFLAFGLRLFLFDRALHRAQKDKTDFVEPSKLPEVIYFIAFSTIGWFLYRAVQDKHLLVPLAILSIFIGAFMMATYRQGSKKNLGIDVLGRVIFVFGFLLNLFNLARTM